MIFTRSYSRFLRWLHAAALLLAPTLISTAQAVVISAPTSPASIAAPANNPGWNNVARMSNASAVYLGNDWMISANHVSDGPVLFSDGRTFNIAPGTTVQLNNLGSLASLGGADLKMFRLAADPGLPALQLGASSPAAGATVMMIGAGIDRAADEIGWQVTSGTGGATTWNQVPLPLANAIGFSLLDTSHMRWGYNQVLSGGLTVAEGNTLAFSTRFDLPGLPFEAQATTGDSGGGVFQEINGSWKLVGLMNAVALNAGQPNGTIAFGNSTLCGDLASYHDPIFNLSNHVWQNPLNRFDVNRSGTVTPQDLLMVINALRTQFPVLGGSPGAADPLFDINGDGFLKPLDALQLINYLREHSAPAAAPLLQPLSAAGLEPFNVVPEPSSAVLALVAALLILLTWARRKKRAS